MASYEVSFFGGYGGNQHTFKGRPIYKNPRDLKIILQWKLIIVNLRDYNNFSF